MNVASEESTGTGSQTTPSRRRELLRAVGLGLVPFAAWSVWSVVYHLVMAIPYPLWAVARAPIQWVGTPVVLMLLAVVFGVEWWARPLAARVRARGGERLDRMDVWAERWLDRRFAIALGLMAACWLLCWVPHYLLWPYWPDSEQFAVAALHWRHGLAPFRDQVDFDFPGQIYTCYLAGLIFGWGKTWTFYAADLVFLFGMGSTLLVWSRRRTGGLLAGLAGLVAVLGMYLSQGYNMAAQRDWQAACLAVTALLALEAWGGRRALVASAGLMGLALAWRPQVVLFFPALLSGIDESVRKPGESVRQTWRGALEWSAWFGLALFLAYAPLIYEGAFDDFVRALRITHYGASYNPTTWRSILAGGFEEATNRSTINWLAIGFVLLVRAPASWRSVARTWLLALAFVVFYRPMSPVPHHYLFLPILLLKAIATAVLAGVLLSDAVPLKPALRLGSLVLLLALSVPLRPDYCEPIRTVEALTNAAQGSMSEQVPLGCYRAARGYFRVIYPGHVFVKYAWTDYQAVLRHLREQTTSETLVASLIEADPYPAINGPTGRRSPFPAAGGVLYLKMVDRSLEDAFARALEEAAEGTRVVWEPDATSDRRLCQIERLRAIVHRGYVPEATFGALSVWRKRPPGQTEAGLADSR